MAKKEISRFNEWDEVAIALKEICEISVEVKKAEALMNESITQIKNAYEDKVREGLERKAELEHQIELYTKAHQAEFVERKSKEFTFGKVGFRKTTEVITRNIRAIIEACKQNKMHDCIVVKEALDKEMLSRYDDEALLKVGARRKEGEKYFIEVRMEEIG